MRFFYGPLLAILLGASAFAQPPVVIPEGGFVDHKIEVPKGAAVVWDISPTPIQEAINLPDGRIIFSGKSGTTYTAWAFMIDFEAKKFTKAKYTFVFGGKIPPVDPPPVDPPPTVGKLFFVIIRPDAPTDPTFTKVMGMPEWATLKAAGHGVVAKTVKEAANTLGITIPASTTLPCVVTVRNNPNGKTSTIVRGPIDLPGTGVGILDLPKGVQ